VAGVVPCKCPDSRQPASYLVTIAGSAGAFVPLCELLEALPSDLRAAVIAVLHTPTGTILAETVGRWVGGHVHVAGSGDLLLPGHIYMAPSGTHVIVNPDARLTVSATGRVRFYRPSADWLLASAAGSYQERHVAVILSGLMSDGASGLRAVKRAGGTVLVQSPEDAAYPSMPSAALATGCVDRALPIAAMAPAICEALAWRNAAVDAAAWDAPFSPAVTT
jgi:two-component system chemotaxis response regulator CheB